MSKGLKRAAARGVVAVVLAAGATAGAVGTASAAPLHHPAPKPKSQHHPAPRPQHCTTVPGHWKLVWHPAYRDRKHHAHAGYWTRVWQPTHRECRR